jgi:hypothetical protein
MLPLDQHNPNQPWMEYPMNATEMPTRLTAEDRAYMLYVARRDYERGESSPEEYREVLERCMHQPSLFSLALNRAHRAFTRPSKPTKARTPGVVATRRHAS